MKKILFAALAATALLLPTACSDDFDEPAGVPQAGDDVCFTVTDINTAPEGKHNTKFGDKTGTQFPIHWQQNDMVRVACSQAHGDKEAIYRVTQNENSNLTSNVEPYQGSVKWEKTGTHYFYGGYPANLVHFDEVVSSTKTTSAPFTAEIPTTQEVTVTETDDEYYCAPNMNYAVMVGSAQGQRTDDPANLKMVFEPAFTAVEITVQSQPEDGMYKYVTFLDISIHDADATTGFRPLSGEFQGTVAKSGTTTTLTYAGTSESYAPKGARNIRVNLDRKVNMSGNKPLRLTVFLLPEVAERLKVSLGAFKGDDENTIYYTYKNITTAVAKRKYNHINMGVMPSYEALKEAGDGLWQAPLDNDVHVSLLTIPGVHDFIGFGKHIAACDMAQCNNGSTTSTQDMRYETQMTNYMNNGNRAFDFRLSYDSSLFTTTPPFGARRFSSAGNSGSSFDFKSIIEAADDWLAQHSTEFFIFLFSDYDQGSNYGSNLRTLLNMIPEHLRLENVPVDAEVKDVRGRIIIINESACNNPMGMNVSNFPFNISPKGTSGGNDASLKKQFSTCTIQDVAGTGPAGTLYVHNYLNAAISQLSGYEAECTEKAELVDAAMHTCAQDHDINHWYIIDTGFRWHDKSKEKKGTCTGDQCGKYSVSANIIHNHLMQHMVDITTNDPTKLVNHARMGIVLFTRASGAPTATYQVDGHSCSVGIEKYFWNLNYQPYSAMRNHDKYYETKKVPFRMD